MPEESRIDPDRTYSITSAARHLGVSASTLRDLERRGKVDSTRTPGRHRRFRGSALLRLREESHAIPQHTARPVLRDTSTPNHETQIRHAWLGQVLAHAQRQLPSDTPAEVRLRLGADVERALGRFRPASTAADWEPLVKSLVQRATHLGQVAQEEAERREMKGALTEFGLTRLRRRIDALGRRVVGPVGSLKRCHVHATLRDEFRAVLHRDLRGDEDWAQISLRAEEFLAAWYVRQTPETLSATAKLLAVGATGAIGGVAVSAALSPEIRARMAELKAPLLTVAVGLLNRISTPPSPAASAPNPPAQATSTAAGPPPVGNPARDRVDNRAC